MAGTAPSGDEAPRTLGEKVNWLIEKAQPAGRGPLSNQDVSFLVARATGEEISPTTILKLRKGQSTNPQMRVIGALARTFGVPPAFFFDEYDETALGLVQDQVEMLTLVRSAGITSGQLRAVLGMSDEGRQVVTELIERTARDVAGIADGQPGQA
jgi:transcriptional regulator with XRE-family HTH domain